MKKKLIVGALLLAAGTTAFAQSKFEGFYGQVGLGFESVSPQLSNSVLNGGGYNNVSMTSSVDTKTSPTGVFTVGYTMPVSKDFYLGYGAEYNPIASQKGNYSYASGAVVGQIQKQNSYNIFIAPSIAIGNDGMAYTKIGYTGASVKNNTTGSTLNPTGYSLGLGYKQIIDGGIYGFAEANYSQYSTMSSSGSVTGTSYTLTTNSSSNTYNLLVGIGYKF